MAESDEKLRPATPDERADALAFALRFNGRKRVHTGDGFMANLTAERLVEHLRMSGFVVMKRPPTGGHSQLSRGPGEGSP